MFFFTFWCCWWAWKLLQFSENATPLILFNRGEALIDLPWGSNITKYHYPNHQISKRNTFTVQTQTQKKNTVSLSAQCFILKLKTFSVTQTWNYESLSLSPLLKIPSFSAQNKGYYSLSFSLWICMCLS